jgi:small-conductance mechanosensitive channel
MDIEDDKTKAKASEILQEIRIVLPGTQALLGFQFVVFFNQVFLSLPKKLQYFHLGTLALTTLCTILLIAPIAYQHIRESGKTTERFIKFSIKMISISMTLLLLALAGDVYIAARLIIENQAIAAFISIIMLILGMSVWFGYTWLKRNGLK